MLNLTRRPGESIIVDIGNGELITIMVCGVDGNQVNIGVTAPKHIPVDREEVRMRRISEGWGR